MAQNPLGTLTPEDAIEQQRIIRQQQMAQMLMQQGAQQPQGQIIGGRYVPPSVFQNLANLANIYVGTRAAGKAEERQLNLAQKLREGEQKSVEEYFKAMSPQPERTIPMAGPFGKGLGEEGQDIPAPVITQERREKPDYKAAFMAATNPYAPSWLKQQAIEMVKPQILPEGATAQRFDFATGQMVPYMQSTSMKLPNDIKSAALRVGLNPMDSATWGEKEWSDINNLIQGDKRAGGTNLVVNTGKAYTGEFGAGVAKEDLGKYSIAEKAPAIFQNAKRTEELLNSGAITGLGAEYKLNLARALNVAGVNNAEIIKNTEQLVANRGQIVLDSIKASGLGAGQGFTDKDRQFLEKVKGGTIELNEKTLRELARIEKGVAQAAVDTWNKRLPNIPKEAIQGTGIGPIQLQNQDGWRIKQ